MMDGGPASGKRGVQIAGEAEALAGEWRYVMVDAILRLVSLSCAFNNGEFKKQCSYSVA